jgi:hypothetical protein
MTLVSDAIGAALIAGGVSVTGLLITNQSKVSEFRQEWIDHLREEISTLIMHAFTIFDSNGANVEVLDKSFAEVRKLTTLITLRLNLDEDESKAIIEAMNALRDEIHKKTTFALVDEKAKALTVATVVVLKMEWERVKTGESVYKWTFRVVSALTIALLFVFVTQNRDSIWNFVFAIK